MSASLPDRLSTNPKSPFYNEALLEAGVGIKFNGAEKTNVEEYCISEGWIRVAVGKTVDRQGRTVNVGPTPVKSLGVTDQHSQLQLYAEGPDDKIITFLGVGEFAQTIELPAPGAEAAPAAGPGPDPSQPTGAG